MDYRDMHKRAIIEALEGKKKGGFYTVETQRPAKMRKGVTLNIEKHSTVQGMLADYANRAAVKLAVQDGTRDEPELPTWVEKVEKLGANEAVKFWIGKEGQVYLPVTLTGNQPQSEWLLDGKKVDVEEIREYLLASEFPKRTDKDELADKGQVPFMAVKIENIVSVR